MARPGRRRTATRSDIRGGGGWVILPVGGATTLATDLDRTWEVARIVPASPEAVIRSQRQALWRPARP